MRPRLVVWLLPLLLLIGAAAYVRAHQARLPDRIPTHYGLNGPDAWGPKSARTLYGPLVIGALVSVNLMTMGIAMSRSPHQSPALLANIRLLLAIHYAVAFMFAVFGTAPARDFNGVSIPAWVPLGTLLGVFVVFGWPVLRAHSEANSQPPAPDEAWRGGMVYYNPSDPALIVEKRFGIGYTMNMAHKAAWLFVAQIFVILAATFWLTLG